MDQAAQGATALASGDFAAAVSHYTDAISSNPQAVDYYIKRSTAYTRTSPPDHSSALQDAEIAVNLASKRGKRELIAQSQLRRGIALFGLERWADARACFDWVRKLNEKEKSLQIWGIKVEGKLKGVEDGDERAQVKVKEIPDVELPKEGPTKKVDKPATQKEPKLDAKPEEVTASAAEPKAEGVQTPASKIRHEWYQTTDTVVVTLFAKGVPKDKAAVNIHQTSLSISFLLPTGSDFEFSLDPFFAPIDHSASSFKIMSTKVEFILKKSTPGQKWSALEGAEPVSSSREPISDNSDLADPIKRAVLTHSSPATMTAPVYPTSSRTGPKDWDKLADSLTKKPKPKPKPKTTPQTKTKAPKPSSSDSSSDSELPPEDEDDGYISDDAGDPVNGFFQKLYKDADPDTKRAMMKSYSESNGTALSTNWEEVGKGKVETQPPEGMEAKKWGD